MKLKNYVGILKTCSFIFIVEIQINYLLPGRYDNEAAATVPYKTLNILSKSLQRLHSNNKIPAGSPIWVHELMKGTKIIVPSIPEKIEVCLFLPQY